MADTIKELLGRWSVDNSSWKSAVVDLRSTLKSAADEDKARADKAKSAQADAIQAANNELFIKQAIAEQASKAVAAETAKQVAIKATQEAAKIAAAEQLAATNRQIEAAEKKAAVEKEALLQQQKAAAQALAFEEAYQAQLKEVAKNKAAAAAAYDAAYEAQVAEVRAKRGKTVQASKPKEDFSEVPIVVGQSTSSTTQATDAAHAENVKTATAEATAVQAAAAEEVAANATVVDSEKAKSAAIAEAYAAQTAAREARAAARAADLEASTAQTTAVEEEVALTQEESAAVSVAAEKYLNLIAAEVELVAAKTAVVEIQQAAVKGELSEAQAVQLLSSNLAALTAAQEAAAKARAEYQAVGIDAVSIERKAQEELGAEILAIQARTNAEAKKAAAERIREINERRRAEEKLGAEILAIQRRQARESGGGLDHGRTGNMMATRGLVGALSGRTGIRPLESLLSTIGPVAQFAQLAFPIVGLTMFIDLLGKGVEAFIKLKTEAADFSDKVKDNFQTAIIGSQKSNDELQKTDDTLLNTIAKLEHKPVNNLAIALDDARIKADGIAEAAIRGFEEVKKLLAETDEGFMSRVINNSASSTDVDADLIAKSRDVKNAKLALESTKRQATLRATKGPNDEIEYAAEDKEKLAVAQGNLDAARKKLLAYTQNPDNAFSKGNKTTTGIVGALGDVLGIRSLQGFGTDVTTNKEKLSTVGTLTENDIDKDALDKKVEDDAAKVKQLEEAKRLNELALKDAQALLEEKKKLNALELENAKDTLSRLGEMNEASYKSGEEDAETYYKNKKALADQDYEATIKNIKAVRDAELNELAIQHDISPAVRKSKTEVINKTADRGIAAAGITRTKTISTADISEKEAADAEAKKRIDVQTEAVQKGLDLQQELTQEAFHHQTISAEEYTAKSIELIKQEVAAVEQATAEKIAINGKNSKENINLLEQQQKAYESAQIKIARLQANAFDLKVQSSTSNFQDRNSVLEGQLTAAQNPNGGGTISQQISLMDQLREGNLKYADEQQRLLSDPSVTLYSKQWREISDNILSAQQRVIQLDESTKNLKNPLNDIGSTLGEAAQAGQGFLTSRYARGVLSAVAGGAASQSAASSQVDQIQQGFGSFSFSEKPSDMLDSFTKGLKGAVGALGSFVNSIANAGSASAGALGGGLSGAGLGQAAGAAAQSAAKPGSFLDSLGSAAGPIGAGIGAALGAVMGGIMGKKQEEVQDDINQLSANFKSIMNSYSSNNSSLAQTVKNLENLIAQAQADEASTKKGGSQFKDLIKQYNDQIIQLEDQQKQIMTQLNNQLIQISSPIAYQPLISSIQDILSQYTSFVGAAQNATELGNANNFLTQSLQNLSTGYSQTLMQDQETAIQEALSLNQLYNQRNQLEQQYLQQVRSIQGQGTLTRGVTLAQSKFSQLYNLDVNQAQQLDTINQQINLAQYQVQAAQQVFQLATTKAGLEAQLLGLQEQGINLDMNRISAMENVINLLAKTGYSLTNLGSLNTSDPNALLTLLLQILSQSLGLSSPGSPSQSPSASPIPAGSSPLDNYTSQAYDQRSSYGYAQFRSANL